MTLDPQTGPLPQPARPLRLTQPVFLALKSGLACAVALGIDTLTGNPDHVSSTFVAVLCLTPMVWLGLRRAGEQALGATLGGTWAALALLAGLPAWLGVPLAVAAAAASYMGVRPGPVGSGFAAAAFTALFVQLVPFGDTTETILVRALAVGTGAASGFLINVLVSGGFARSIFERRLGLVRDHVHRHIGTAVAAGPEAIRAVFAALGDVEEELAVAIEELRWRRATDRHHLRERRREVRTLRHLAHVAAEVHYAIRTQEDPIQTTAAVLEWLADRSGPPPAGAEESLERLLAAEEAAAQARLR